MPQLLRTALKERNFLVHRYFLEREEQFATRSGRMAMLQELLAIQGTLEKAATLSRAIRIALNDALEGKPREAEDETDVLATLTVSTERDR